MIHNLIENHIKKAHDVILKSSNEISLFLERKSGTPEAEFLLKFLSWMEDPIRKRMLYGIFQNVISFNETNFLPSLWSFLMNCFIDDTYFIIEWRKLYLDDFNGFNPLKSELTSKDDPKGFPVVIFANDGKKDANLLIQAMDLNFERFLVRKEQMELEEKMI